MINYVPTIPAPCLVGGLGAPKCFADPPDYPLCLPCSPARSCPTMLHSLDTATSAEPRPQCLHATSETFVPVAMLYYMCKYEARGAVTQAQQFHRGDTFVNELTVVGLEWLGALTLFLGFILLVRYLDHRERMSMIQHGITTTPDVPHPRSGRGSAVLRGGLITGMVGLAVTFGLYTLGYLLPAPFSAAPGRFGPWLLPGLIPTGVGIALVASYYLAPPRSEPSSSTQQQPTDAPTPSSAADADVPAVSEPPSTHDPRNGNHRRSGLRVVDAAPDDQGSAHG